MPQDAYRLDILDTLYLFDEPLLFVARDGLRQSLFLKTDETSAGHEFLACYIDDARVKALRDGRISVRGAYEAQADLSIVTTDFEYMVTGSVAFRREATEVVKRLPEPGVGVLPRMGKCPDHIPTDDMPVTVDPR